MGSLARRSTLHAVDGGQRLPRRLRARPRGDRSAAQGTGKEPVSDPGKAVFLSYASQDAEVARRICETLRASGVEVWFDQSELVGGDAWDQKIRKQIKDCALLIPIISGATQARTE